MEGRGGGGKERGREGSKERVETIQCIFNR